MYIKEQNPESVLTFGFCLIVYSIKNVLSCF